MPDEIEQAWANFIDDPAIQEAIRRGIPSKTREAMRQAFLAGIVASECVVKVLRVDE